MEIKITKTTNKKQKPEDQSKLGFGQFYTDHMLDASKISAEEIKITKGDK